MADIYIINSENPKDIALELQQLDSKNQIMRGIAPGTSSARQNISAK